MYSFFPHNLQPCFPHSQSKTIKQFDSAFTSKHFGYKDVDSYYTDATLHNKLHQIKVPLLCLSAADDPFQPLDAIPIKAAAGSSHVAILITARGGHIGFLEGWWPANKDQYMGRLFSQYFSAALFDPDNEFYRTAQLMMEHNLTASTSVPGSPTNKSALGAASAIRKKSIPF